MKTITPSEKRRCLAQLPASSEAFLPTFTLVVWSTNGAAPVQAAALATARWSSRPIEVIGVSIEQIEIISTTEISAAVTGCFRQINPTSGETIWHGLAEAMRTASGDLIAFLNSDCAADADWLTKIGTAFTDPKLGCAGGDIIVVGDKNDGRDDDLSPQRIALSGWRGVPFVRLDNAVFRRTVFDRIGNLKPELGSAAEADIAVRLLRQTEFRLAFAPGAAVRRASPDPATIWDAEIEAAHSFSVWLKSTDSSINIPVAKMTAAARDGMTGLASDLAALDVKRNPEATKALANIRRVARLLGVLKDGAGDAAFAGARPSTCSLCGGTTYVPGPSGRMNGERAPQCAQCASLERHRVLNLLLKTQSAEESNEIDILSVGEALRKEQRRFRNHHHLSLEHILADAPHFTVDMLAATNIFSSTACEDIVSVLEALARRLRGSSTLIVLERLQALQSITARQGGGNMKGYIIGSDFGAVLSRLLPGVHVGSSLLRDDVTGEVMIAVVASREPQVVSRMITGAQVAMLIGK